MEPMGSVWSLGPKALTTSVRGPCKGSFTSTSFKGYLEDTLIITLVTKSHDPFIILRGRLRIPCDSQELFCPLHVVSALNWMQAPHAEFRLGAHNYGFGFIGSRVYVGPRALRV